MSRVRGAIAAGRDWLDRHAANLLPDTLVFAEIGLRAARIPLPRRLRPPGVGRTALAFIPLSHDFRRIAAGAGPLYRSYREEPPLASARSVSRHGSSTAPPSRTAMSASMDGSLVN